MYKANKNFPYVRPSPDMTEKQLKTIIKCWKRRITPLTINSRLASGEEKEYYDECLTTAKLCIEEAENNLANGIYKK